MVHAVITKQAKNASAEFLWEKLAAYSDMSWHPQIESSKNTGSIEDGSDKMIGAERVLVNTAGKRLVETVTAWSGEERTFALSIDEGAPAFAKSIIIKSLLLPAATRCHLCYSIMLKKQSRAEVAKVHTIFNRIR